MVSDHPASRLPVATVAVDLSTILGSGRSRRSHWQAPAPKDPLPVTPPRAVPPAPLITAAPATSCSAPVTGCTAVMAEVQCSNPPFQPLPAVPLATGAVVTGWVPSAAESASAQLRKPRRFRNEPEINLTTTASNARVPPHSRIQPHPHPTRIPIVALSTLRRHRHPSSSTISARPILRRPAEEEATYRIYRRSRYVQS